jgi:hypothetical protein
MSVYYEFELEDVTREQWVDAQVTSTRRTVRAIAKFHKLQDREREIADRNSIRSLKFKMKIGRKIKIPKPKTTPGTNLRVQAGDEPPRIVGGYAEWDIVDRPQRVGLSQFRGYDPITVEIPIRFDNFQAGGMAGGPTGYGAEGLGIEADIRRLERMAGRGLESVNGVGPPGRVKVATTDESGKVVPLLSANYQAHPLNPSPPSWVIAGIEWESGALRNRAGNRVRQLATVTLQQHVSTSLTGRSAATTAKSISVTYRKKGRSIYDEIGAARGN